MSDHESNPAAQKSIKVLHVVLSLDPGGMENGVINLVNGLDAAVFDLRVCCLIRAGGFAGRLPAGKISNVLDKQPGFSWNTVCRLRKVFREFQPAIVHTHNLGTLIYSVLARSRISCLPILHGEHAEFAPSDLTLRRRLQRSLLYRFAERIVPVSDSLGGYLVAHGAPGEKVRPINNGVDTERFVPGDSQAAKQRLGLPAKAPVVGMVGRFGPYKRHDLLIAAFEALAKEQPDVHLLLVGGGGLEEARIQSMVKQSPVRSRIHWAGFQDDPRPYYQAMDLLVLPSSNEGMSNAALEAMATSVPVLCHTACGHADIIKDGLNGYVRSMENPQQLKQMLAELLGQENALRAAGAAGREFVIERLSWQRMRAEYSRLYREIAEIWFGNGKASLGRG